MFLLMLFVCSCLQPGLNEDVKDYDSWHLFSLFKSLLDYRPDDVTLEDVTFYLYTRNITNLQIPIDSHEGVDTSKNTKIIIHGWIDNHNRSWYNDLTDEYLKKGDFNVIHVDWGRVARSFYLSSAQNTKLVGNLVGDFIINHGLDAEKVHLIGHSLGAHIAGFAGQEVKRKTGKTVARITGLDPAGPGFRNYFDNDSNRLDVSDAHVVDVIHTDGGMLGCLSPLGSFDIYLNGGIRIQPDCHISLVNIESAAEAFEDLYCSHTRSYIHFTDIINRQNFTCTKCDSVLKYAIGWCNSTEQYVFGAEDIDDSMRGVCFVNTQ